MFRNTFYKKNNHSNKISGFGLIELLISISIMILVTSMVLSQHNAFNSGVLLRGQAYEVALQAREVQLNAVSIVGDGGDFRRVYGLHFNSGLSGYKIFQDSNGNDTYDVGEEFGKQGKLDSRFIIDEIRTYESDGTEDVVNFVSVLFERPNFDARFKPEGGNTGVSRVEIDIRINGTAGSGPGEVRKVEITRTGQISVI